MLIISIVYQDQDVARVLCSCKCLPSAVQTHVSDEFLDILALYFQKETQYFQHLKDLDDTMVFDVLQTQQAKRNT